MAEPTTILQVKILVPLGLYRRCGSPRTAESWLREQGLWPQGRTRMVRWYQDHDSGAHVADIECVVPLLAPQGVP